MSGGDFVRRIRALAATAEARAARGDASEERLQALLDQGRALRALGDARVADVLLGALDLADSLGRADLGRLASIELGAWLVGAGDPGLGRAHLERALEEARRADDAPARAHHAAAAAELARAWVLERDPTRARAALALTDPGSPRAQLARGLVAQLQERPEEARGHFQRAVAAGQSCPDPLEGCSVALAASEALEAQALRAGGGAALEALDEDQLRRTLAAVLAICGAAASDAAIVAAEAIRTLTGAAAVELELPGGERQRAPAADVEAWSHELRAGRLTLRLVAGPEAPHAQLLARVALGACGRLGEGPPEVAGRVLHLLDRLLASDLEGEQLFGLATELAVEATGAARGRMVLAPSGLRSEANPGPEEGDFVSRSLLRHVLLSGRPLLIEDAAASPPSGAGESVGARGLRSVLAAPLLGRRGQVLGVLYLDDPGTAGRFGASELGVATGFAARLGPQVETHLRERLRREARRDALTQGEPGMASASPSMRPVLALLEKAIQVDVPVLLHGEAGVGKERLARAIHRASPRREAPFVVVSCATLPDELLESELFGHKAGAFTDARADRDGLFQSARGGVIFLEGLQEASPRLQAELLRAVESGEIRPLGGQTERVDVRVVTAFDGDPAAAVQAGSLRQDLFYRLSVLRIAVPPLRERREDLPALAESLLEELGVARRELGPGVLARLEAHDWPGNLRELQACLERALLEAGDGAIRPSHVQVEPRREPVRGALKLNPRQLRLIDSLQPGQVIKAGEYAETYQVSPATAWRDLTDLVSKGLLEGRGKGRGAMYRLLSRAPG